MLWDDIPEPESALAKTAGRVERLDKTLCAA